MTRTVLLTDGGERSTLAAVRSLGAAGYRTLVCAPRTPSLAGRSCHCAGEIRVPDPERDPESYRWALASLVWQHRPDVLVPMTEASLQAVLSRRDWFESTRIPFPDLKTFRRATDKAAVTTLAREVGLAVPEQWIVREPGRIHEILRENPTFPLAVKPSRSVDRAGGRAVHYARNPDELRDVLDGFHTESHPLLVQRKIHGEGTGIFLLRWKGELAAVFAHRRLREKPPSGGVSVYRESVPADPELVERSRTLLEALDWEGVAMVEFKEDHETGVPYLMEVNPRFWGSLQLAVDAGVDFPALLVAAALGEPLPPPSPYRIGVRTRWIWGDVDNLVIRLRDGPDANGSSGNGHGGGRWRALGEFAAGWGPGSRQEVFRMEDVRPFLHESWEWMRSTASRVGRR